MKTDFEFTVKRINLDENYHPCDNTRITTNFANLARGSRRKENLRNALAMINNTFNALAHWDNPTANRYRVELEIISVTLTLNADIAPFPAIEVLKTTIFDSKTDSYIEGVVGNNFSSYVRDYDFSILLLEHNNGKNTFSIPEQFGQLHGDIFKDFISSNTYKQQFKKPPIICLSVSDSKTYHRTSNTHPVLGIEYQPNDSSLTELYFKKMGLHVRYFMPAHCTAPLAFYFTGDLLNDYSNLEIISTISTMETFQKIYRPEIYNANTIASQCYQPNLQSNDYSLTQIVYDRQERSQLAIEQGKFAEQHFIKPYQALINDLSLDLA
ncbi:DUF1852 family protein [Pseudoalteromonas sp. MMG010]|uniref:putative oxygenase MesX n=1 Tax=Pseudoalteromonas sp. MMG010 TaxID=2822685 RepID=UPI001B39D8D7|nr:putative oxygenase MesX [Pseudoalteromonas sp. MMG010]MBQ4834197.1 DUF1852 family protein [Pseudoalteromonas sp. MMG010]